MQSLVKLNGVYYFRLRVPQDIKQWFPSPTLKKSLKVRRYDLAKEFWEDFWGRRNSFDHEKGIIYLQQ